MSLQFWDVEPITRDTHESQTKKGCTYDFKFRIYFDWDGEL